MGRLTYADLMPPIAPLRPEEVDHEAELALINDLDDFSGSWMGPDLARHPVAETP